MLCRFSITEWSLPTLCARHFSSVRPDAVAIELPPTLELPFLRALRRLPQISVISYQAEVKKGSGQGGRETVYLLVEPADPFVEAARLALESGVPLHFVDVDTDSYPRHHEQLPDSYSICRIGLEEYYNEYRKSSDGQIPCLEDRRREQGMAYRLQRLAQKQRRILYVCGMAHLERVKQSLRRSPGGAAGAGQARGGDCLQSAP